MTVTVLEESLPNLTIDSHNLSSITGGTEGTAITLQGTLRNSGTAATPVDVYSNFTYKWGAAGTWTPIQEFNKGTVAANTTATQDETSFTPNQAGSLYLQYCVDSRNEIDEGTDETPNCTESAEVVVDAFEPPTLFFDHSCVPGILAEANSCNTARVTWNLQAGSGNYLVRNITTGNIISTASTSPAGGQLITLRYGNNIVEGSATGIAPDLSVPRFQDCALGLFYYPMQNRCKNKPQLTFPTLNSSSTWIRSGKLQEISYQVVANYPVRCTYTPDTGGILSKLSADFANPVGPAGGTDTFTVGPLKSAQIVRITCQANPPVPGSVVSREIRVNVVPEMIER